MNNKVLIAIAVVVLLLIGGAGFLMLSKNKSKTAPVSTTGTQTKKTEEPQTGPKSLKDLLAAGISQKCSFNDVTDNVSTQGSTFITGGKMRSDFSSTVEGKTSSGHSIFDGKTSYVWMDGTTTGFKMDIDPSVTSTPGASNQQGVDMNKNIDYKCSAWVTDQSVFNPPSDVTFTSFAMPTSAGDNSTNGNSSLCSSCNSLTGEQKTQCLTALKCN